MHGVFHSIAASVFGLEFEGGFGIPDSRLGLGATVTVVIIFLSCTGVPGWVGSAVTGGEVGCQQRFGLEAKKLGPSRAGSVKNFNPATERDFVFDLVKGRFATGANQGIAVHDGFRAAIGADEATVLGGRLSRGLNGEFLTNEWSGHYGDRWNAELREQFVDFTNGFGLKVVNLPWQDRL